jgi:MerR family transcriptional regulator, copper efflux regulator
MLRYREALGLLPATSDGIGHRRYDDEDLSAAALAMTIESRYGIGPRAIAFALRTLADPDAQALVRELGERVGRLTPPTRALDFETEKARRLLGRPGSTAASAVSGRTRAYRPAVARNTTPSPRTVVGP